MGGIALYMNNAKFNPDESFSIIMYFYREIEIALRDKFGREWADVGGVAGCMFNDTDTTFEDWERCYKATFGKDPEKSDLLNPEQIFTSMIDFTALYLYEFDFKIAILLELLHSMRDKPDEHKQEWGIWNKVVEQQIGFQNRPKFIPRNKPKMTDPQSSS
jgi:hypothetical protein